MVKISLKDIDAILQKKKDFEDFIEKNRTNESLEVIEDVKFKNQWIDDFKSSSNYTNYINYGNFQNTLIKNFQAAILVLKPSDVTTLYKQCLDSAIHSAPINNGFIDESVVYTNLVQNIETWYSQLQNRISIWYKKTTKRRIFALALVLAIVFNVDTIQLYKFYQKNPAVTQSIISNFKENQQIIANLIKEDSVKNAYDNKNINTKNDSLKKLNTAKQTTNLKDTQKRTIPAAFTIDSNSVKNVKLLTGQSDTLLKIIDSLTKELQLPIGINFSIITSLNNINCEPSCSINPCQKEEKSNDSTNTKCCEEKESCCGIIGFFICLFYKIIGYLITAFAASFGAPFWFDLLKKIITKKI